MAPTFSFIISSRSKKKEPRYECLSEARVSHAHKTWTQVSSSVPHFLQVGLLLSPITYKCRLRVLCPVRRPMTTLENGGHWSNHAPYALPPVNHWIGDSLGPKRTAEWNIWHLLENEIATPLAPVCRLICIPTELSRLFVKNIQELLNILKGDGIIILTVVQSVQLLNYQL